MFTSGLGTAGQDSTLTILQASDNSGTGSKALSPTTDPPHVFKKQAATDLSAVTSWTDATSDVTANAVTNADMAEQSLILVVEIKAIQLDVDNGFDHLSCTVADVGANAQPGSLLYILTGLRHQDDPTNLQSPIG